MRRAFENPLAFLLRNTTQHAEDFSFARFPLELLQTAEYLLLRFVANATGVIENEFRLLGLLHLAIPLLHQRADNFFRVVRVHLATKGLDVKRLHSDFFGTRGLQSAMKQAHEPTDAKERQHETAETIKSVMEAFAVRSLRDQAENDAGKEGEEDGSFKVIECDLHKRIRRAI